MNARQCRFPNLLLNAFILLVLIVGVLSPQSVSASHTPVPASVTIAGSLQSEVGCAGDWDPACALTHLTYDAGDDAWQGTWAIPAGSYEYKAALNDSWDENYGLGAVPNGLNIPLSPGADTSVKFYYDHKSHWITDSLNSVIAVAAGSFQSELGCPGDWQPDCLRSWLQDPDGDGIYTFETTALPAGSYETKVALNETWDVNYGQGGVFNGPNIPFTVPVNNALVSFRYDSTSHVLTILSGHALDNNVEWDGLHHDSRDTLYRTPGGAVPAGTPVILRFRTFHNDVNRVRVRLYDLNASAQSIVDMSLAASDISCYQAGLENESCDYWAYTLTKAQPDNLWYRFIIMDGTDTDYYADNTPALDGGLGAASDDAVDNSYALMAYDPSFSTPGWAQNAVIYQIFPDRFRSGRKDNDPKTGDVRYDDPVLKLAWGALPEGYCRAYAGAAANCAWRYGAPLGSTDPVESPRGRDYYGGDLRGVDQNLEYLKSLGVNTLYFNPIFDAASNHGYDTQDYYKIDPYFGTQKDWENLVKHAKQLGIRIILDGVFNHMSSDSPFFDRYHHYSTSGACESLTSPYRNWFTFHDVSAGTGTCVGTAGPNSANYDGWFGFDSIPVLNKSLPAVQEYFVTSAKSVSRTWLKAGASGWRLDVMGDTSFPNGYWESFRTVVKSTQPDALIIGELWQKDSTLLRFLRGDRADTTMNYRLRDAVLGLLAPQSFDAKGFADSGRSLSASEFASRIASIQEDYPAAAYTSLMNLLGSHDTARLLWLLTPGTATRADKELNAANLAAGKQLMQMASLIQFTLPGAPTIYYGDEVAVTGNDDPDNRRTYPWADLGGAPDLSMFKHYQTLASLRRNNTALTAGDLRVLFADDAAGTVAYGRKTASQAALVVINRSTSAQTVTILMSGYLPDGIVLNSLYHAGNPGSVPTPLPTAFLVENGAVTVTLGAQQAWLLASGMVDLQPAAAPANLHVASEGDAQISLAWNTVPGASAYNLYRSYLSGGGWIKVNAGPINTTDFNDTGLRNAQVYYYVVTSLDGAGNESGFSNEASGIPHLTIGWANLQWPPSMTQPISAVNRTEAAYGQVWIDGVTNLPGQTPGLRAQLGFGPSNSSPDGSAEWVWVEAAFNGDAGNNDEFTASMLPEAVGNFDYAFRYTTTNGQAWIYADLDGIGNGYDPAQAGKLSVVVSGDSTPPAAPTGLTVLAASPAAIELFWDAVTGDPSLYGYEVLRSAAAGGPYTMIARVTSNTYTDTVIAEGATYYYVVRALDESFNRSGNSNEVTAAASFRTVTVVFNVSVPAATDGTGLSVYIAGTLDRLDGGLPQWDAAGVVLTRVDATHWTATLTGQEATQIEYKYVLGDWLYVEKDASCGEIANRQLTLSYGANGTQSVNDTVLNWRNVAPCGN